MTLIDRIIGWFCISLAFSLFTPNTSYLYYMLSTNNTIFDAIVILISVGYGTIHSSYLNRAGLRTLMLLINIITWGFFALTTMTKGPIGPMSLVIMAYCISGVVGLAKNR